LEQTLAVLEGGGRCGLVRSEQIRVRGERALDVVDDSIVLAVEHLVDRGQRDVLVAATVATDEVEVEQLVVVATGRARRGETRAGGGVRVLDGGRRRAVGDVIEER